GLLLALSPSHGLFDIVRSEYGAPAFVTAGVDAMRRNCPTWSSPRSREPAYARAWCWDEVASAAKALKRPARGLAARSGCIDSLFPSWFVLLSRSRPGPRSAAG